MTGKADSLQHHPVFGSSSNEEGSWEEIQGAAHGLVGRKKQLLATRGSDVIVAQGKELRMANLSTEGAPAENAAGGHSYVVSMRPVRHVMCLFAADASLNTRPIHSVEHCS